MNNVCHINKKITAVLLTLSILLMFSPTVFAAVGEWISIQEAAKDLENEKVTNEANASFYELAYAKALPGEWRQAVLIAIGDLPKDTPRLSAEQAAKLFDSKEISDLESEFNKITGAPDFCWR